MKKRWKVGAAVLALGFPFYWLLSYCNHKFTRPFTTKKNKNNKQETYVVCLRCGKEFEFDFGTMQVGKRREKP